MFSIIHMTMCGVQRLTENWLLGAAARALFASTLLMYFWNSAILKTYAREREPWEDFETSPLVDVERALSQMAPLDYANALNGAASFGFWHHVMAWTGTYAEFILPACIVVGLLTRYAAAGMIIFIAVHSWVDVYGHGVPASSAEFFDAAPDAVISDQRLFWIFPLLYLALRGAGWLSVDGFYSWLTKTYQRRGA